MSFYLSIYQFDFFLDISLNTYSPVVIILYIPRLSVCLSVFYLPTCADKLDIISIHIHFFKCHLFFMSISSSTLSLSLSLSLCVLLTYLCWDVKKLSIYISYFSPNVLHTFISISGSSFLSLSLSLSVCLCVWV